MFRKIVFPLGFIIISCLVTLALFALVEGSASIYLAFKKVPPAAKVAESAHSEFDSALGWINLPDVERKDHYGPGNHLKINAQGLRADKDYTKAPPQGKTRIVCSGDSFTMGYGVNNQKTWPAFLEQKDPRLEVLNMGQGGYGVDQSFLWYKKDGLKLKHQVHLFAFFVGDFHRMSLEEFNGYPKPYLALDKGQVIPANLPLSEPSSWRPCLARYAGALRELKVVALFQEAGSRPGKRKPFKLVYPMQGEEIVRITGGLFRELEQISRQKDITLAAVWLPFEREYRNPRYDHFRKQIKRVVEAQGVRFLDLVPDFRKLPADQLKSLFIQHDIKNYVGSKGHYTAKGNRYMAGLIYEKLNAMPEFKALSLAPFSKPGPLAGARQ